MWPPADQPTRRLRTCPDCATLLDEDPPSACPTCALPLTGPAALELQDLDAWLATATARRRELLAQLRATAPLPASAAEKAAEDADAPTTPSPRPAEVPRPAATAQQVLLGLGVFALLAASLTFLYFAWSAIGTVGRVGLLALVTAVVLAGARIAHGRGLGSTAEFTSFLGLSLLMGDLIAARGFGLWGLDAVDGATFALVAALIMLVASRSYAVLLPGRRAPGLVMTAVLAAVPVVVALLPPLRESGIDGTLGVAVCFAGAAGLTAVARRPGALFGPALPMPRTLAVVAVLYGAFAEVAVVYLAHERSHGFGVALGLSGVVAALCSATYAWGRVRITVPDWALAVPASPDPPTVPAVHAVPEGARAEAARTPSARVRRAAGGGHHVAWTVVRLLGATVGFGVAVSQALVSLPDSTPSWVLPVFAVPSLGALCAGRGGATLRPVMNRVARAADCAALAALALYVATAYSALERSKPGDSVDLTVPDPAYPLAAVAAASAAAVLVVAALARPRVALLVRTAAALLLVVAVSCAEHANPERAAAELTGLAVLLVLLAVWLAARGSGGDRSAALRLEVSLIVPAAAALAAAIWFGIGHTVTIVTTIPLPAIVLLVGALTAFAYAVLPGRLAAAYAGVALAAAANAAVAGSHSVSVVEVYSLPAAALLAVVGMFLVRTSRAVLPSWITAGPVVSTALAPTAAVAVFTGDTRRAAVLLGVSAAVVVVGVFAKLAAPVVSGAIAVVAAVLPLLLVVLRGVPNWVPLSAAGLLLLLAGVTFEARMRDVRRLRGWLAGLH